MNQDGWQTGEIGIERGRQGRARVRVAEIVARARTDIFTMKHGATAGVGADGIAGGGKVGPRRKDGRARRKLHSGFAKREQQAQDKAAASGISAEDDIFRRVALAEQASIGGDGVIECGGEAIFGRQPVVRGEAVNSLKRESYGNRPVRLRGTREGTMRSCMPRWSAIRG